jgi:hypothetical protein
VRPRPAGAAIAATTLQGVCEKHPDLAVHKLAAPIVEAVSKIAAAVPGHAAAARFAEAAAEQIVTVIDGRPASWYATRIQERSGARSALRRRGPLVASGQRQRAPTYARPV